MGYTAQELIRHLGTRRHDLTLSTVDPSGDATHLVDTALSSLFVEDFSHLGMWVYGSLTADILNRGSEVRALSYDAGAYSLTLAQPGMPAAVTTGIYEIRTSTTHALCLEAINSALSLLDLWWSRPIRDESLTTIEQTMVYTLPSTIDWMGLGDLRVYLQASTATEVTGFPFVDATTWNPYITRDVSAAGAETFLLQFGSTPPAGRTIRLTGSAGYAALVADSDILAVDGVWGQKAFEWIMAYASYQITDWSQDQGVSGDVRTAQAILGNRLEKQRRMLLEGAQGRENTLISVPGIRTGARPAHDFDLGRMTMFSTPGA